MIIKNSLLILFILFSSQAFPFGFFLPVPSIENETDQIQQEDLCFDLIKDEEKSVDLQKLKVSVSGDADSGKMELWIEEKYNKGKLNEVMDNLINPEKLNLMSEMVRIVENGTAYQKTTKIGSDKAYTLATLAGGVAYKVKIPIGTTKMICAKVKNNGVITVHCGNDAADEGTNEFLNKATTEITCAQEAKTILCSRHLYVDAKKFSQYGKHFSGYEVAFRSGMSATRNNLGLSNLFLGLDTNGAYALHNCSGIETKINDLITNFKPKSFSLQELNYSE